MGVDAQVLHHRGHAQVGNHRPERPRGEGGQGRAGQGVGWLNLVRLLVVLYQAVAPLG
jgi:hypothetical protein